MFNRRQLLQLLAALIPARWLPAKPISANEKLFDRWIFRDSHDRLQAADAVNQFTRTKMREDGFFRKIMPPVAINNEELV